MTDKIDELKAALAGLNATLKGDIKVFGDVRERLGELIKRRMASWGWVHRALQLSLISIVCGLAYYSAITGQLDIVAFPISLLLVSFGAVVTFWSSRRWVSALVALVLIALAPVSFFVTIELLPLHVKLYRVASMGFFAFNYGTMVGPVSAPILAAAGVLFLLRRCLRLAIDVSVLISVLVLLGG